MRRKPCLFAAIGLLALAATACRPSDRTIAEVDGVRIAKSEVFEEVDALARINSETDRPPASAAPSSVAAEIALRITAELYAQGAKSLGVAPGEEAVAAQRAGVDAELNAFGELGDVISSRFRDFVATYQATRSAVDARIADRNNKWYTDADIDKFYEQNLTTRFTTACVSHIVVATESEAREIRNALDRGAQFATFVGSSIDADTKGKGGDLGCNPRGVLDGSIDLAVTGAGSARYVGPIQTADGFHVLRVDKPYAPEVLNGALRKSIGESLHDPQTWLRFRAAQTEVTVAKRYGTWDPELASVLPPARV